MKFRLRHTTSYQYGAPVFLEPHHFRLMPRGGAQRLLSYELKLDPAPAGITELLDAEGNAGHYAWFKDRTDRLTVTSSFEVETLRRNPFDYVLADLTIATVPVAYSDGLAEILRPYSQPTGPDRSVYALAREAAQEVEWQTLPFLAALTQRIYRNTAHIVREEGPAQAAADTLRQQTGACRDVAMLFVEACRTMRLAARFVSGYEPGAAQQERSFMHAWAEVFLPGGGWRGYDPSRGLATAENHVAVASGRSPEAAAPITGTFRGDNALAAMDFQILAEQI